MVLKKCTNALLLDFVYNASVQYLVCTAPVCSELRASNPFWTSVHACCIWQCIRCFSLLFWTVPTGRLHRGEWLMRAWVSLGSRCVLRRVNWLPSACAIWSAARRRLWERPVGSCALRFLLCVGCGGQEFPTGLRSGLTSAHWVINSVNHTRPYFLVNSSRIALIMP